MPKNKVENRKNAGGFVDIVRDIARQEIADGDTTAVCTVESVNADGTLNLYVLPDTHNVITNIINQCRFDFQSGDTALLYKIGNRTSNAFVIAKYNAKQSETPLAKSGVETSVIDLAKQDRTLNNATKANKKNITVINQNISNINNDIAVISSKLGIISTKISYLNGDIDRIDSSLEDIRQRIDDIDPMEILEWEGGERTEVSGYANNELLFVSYTGINAPKSLYYSGVISRTEESSQDIVYTFSFDGLDSNSHYRGSRTKTSANDELYAGEIFSNSNLTTYLTDANSANRIFKYDPSDTSHANISFNTDGFGVEISFDNYSNTMIKTEDGYYLTAFDSSSYEASSGDTGFSPEKVINLKQGDILLPVYLPGILITTPGRYLLYTVDRSIDVVGMFRPINSSQGGSGTVTRITAGSGLKTNPAVGITSSGDISLDDSIEVSSITAYNIDAFDSSYSGTYTAYSDDSSYVVGDVVNIGDCWYECKGVVVGKVPGEDNDLYWLETLSQPYGNPFVFNQIYEVNNQVVYNGMLYRCKGIVKGENPRNSTYWTLINKTTVNNLKNLTVKERLFIGENSLDVEYALNNKAGKGTQKITEGQFYNGQFTFTNGVSLMTDGLYWFTYGNCQAFGYITSAMINASSSSPIRVPMAVILSGSGSAIPGTLRIEKSNTTNLIVTLKGYQNNTYVDVANGYRMSIFKTELI